MCTYVFASDLFLSELHLYQRSDVGEELPPWPAFDAPILLYVLLDAADGQILDLSTHATTQGLIRTVERICSLHLLLIRQCVFRKTGR